MSRGRVVWQRCWPPVFEPVHKRRLYAPKASKTKLLYKLVKGIYGDGSRESSQCRGVLTTVDRSHSLDMGQSAGFSGGKWH